MPFNLDNYELVEERLRKWWSDNADGSIQTELVNRQNANPDEFVFVARLYRTTTDAMPVATGWASEIRTGTSFNKFACELAESSAIGRALANYIYSKKGARPSRTEMERVTNYSAPGTRARAVEDALRASFADDREPKTFSVGEVANVIPFKPTPVPLCDVGKQCAAGTMRLMQGVSKTTKKPYYGFVCSAPRGTDESAQCKAKWAKILDNGSYYFPDDVEDGKGGE